MNNEHTSRQSPAIPLRKEEKSTFRLSHQAVVFVTQRNYRIFIKRNLFLSSKSRLAFSFYPEGQVEITKWLRHQTAPSSSSSIIPDTHETHPGPWEPAGCLSMFSERTLLCCCCCCGTFQHHDILLQ